MRNSFRKTKDLSLRLSRTKFYYASSKIKRKIGKAFVAEARRHHLEVFLRGVLKICTKFTGEYLYRSVISIMFLCNFIEITLQHENSPVNLLQIFRTPFPDNTSNGLLASINPELRLAIVLYYPFVFISSRIYALNWCTCFKSCSSRLKKIKSFWTEHP